MILKRDPRWKYSRQLTLFQEELEEIDFALEYFKDSPDKHCVVRKSRYGEYAVFAEPIIANDGDRLELLEERTALEEEYEVCVIDIDKEI